MYVAYMQALALSNVSAYTFMIALTFFGAAQSVKPNYQWFNEYLIHTARNGHD